MVLRRQQALLCALSKALKQGVQQALRVVKQRWERGRRPSAAAATAAKAAWLVNSPAGSSSAQGRYPASVSQSGRVRVPSKLPAMPYAISRTPAPAQPRQNSLPSCACASPATHISGACLSCGSVRMSASTVASTATA